MLDPLRLRRFFPDLSDEHLGVLASVAEPVEFAPGRIVLTQGRTADACFAIEAGDVALSTFAAGRADHIIETLHVGDLLGWSWLFPPYQWAFDGRAMTQVAAIRLDGAALRDLVDADAEFGLAVVRRVASVIVDRLQHARVQRMDLYG